MQEKRGEERLHATLGRATHDGLGWDGRERTRRLLVALQEESRRGRTNEKAGTKTESVHARRGRGEEKRRVGGRI